MKISHFINHDHAASYLQSSLIRYKGEPQFIRQVDAKSRGGYWLHLMTIDGRAQMSKVSGDDPELDFSPVPLGFINFYDIGVPSQVIRSARIPLRVWKVGLTENTLHLSMPDGRREELPISRRSMISSPYLYNTIKGNYPTLAEARKSLSLSGGAMAFGRKFAIDSGGLLFHLLHNKPIGMVRTDGSRVLHKEYEFLKESIQMVVNE